MQFIFLIGPPGAGKTACGQALSRLFQCEFYDTDQLIQAQQGRSVSEIFAAEGESHFRKLESELLDTLDKLPSQSSLIIVGTGGGLPIYNDNLKKLSSLGKVVALSAELPVLVQRLENNTERPLLSTNDHGSRSVTLHDRLSELMIQRSPVYGQAGYKIDTSRLSPEEVAHEIFRIVS